MNQNRGPTDTISCLAMEIPGRQTSSLLKIWSKRNTLVEPGGPGNRQEDTVPTKMNRCKSGLSQSVTPDSPACN